MSPLDHLIALDHWLFLKINTVWTNSAFDFFFPYITDLAKRPLFAYFVFPALLVYSIYRGRKKAMIVLLGGVISFAISDGITHRVYKQMVKRQRPEFVLGKENIVLRTHSHSGHSFPSNHASNSFAVMVFLVFFLKRYRWWLMLYAFLVAYSRVYVGVHFPIDVTIGGLSGTLIALLVYTAYSKTVLRSELFQSEKAQIN